MSPGQVSHLSLNLYQTYCVAQFLPIRRLSIICPNQNSEGILLFRWAMECDEERRCRWEGRPRRWLAKSGSNCGSQVGTAPKCHGSPTLFWWLLLISSYLSFMQRNHFGHIWYLIFDMDQTIFDIWYGIHQTGASLDPQTFLGPRGPHREGNRKFFKRQRQSSDQTRDPFEKA